MQSVGSRLMAIILTIAIIGMALIAAIGVVLAGNSLHDQSLGRISEATARDSEAIDVWVQKNTRYIEAIADDFAVMEDMDSDTILPMLIRHSDDNPDYYAVYVGYPDGTGAFSDLWVPDYNEWKAFEREWYQGAVANPGVPYITDLYIDATTGEFCLTLSVAITQGNNILGVMAVDIFTSVLDEVVFSASVGDKSYAFLTDSEGYIMEHHNPDYAPSIDSDEETVFHNLDDIADGHYAGLLSKEVMEGSSIKLSGTDGITRYYTAYIIDTTGWVLYTAIPVSVVDAPIYRQIIAAIIVFVIVLVAAIATIYFSLKKLIMVPVKDVTEAANLLALGNSGAKLEGEYIGEIALLADSFRGMEEFNRQQSEWLESIAEGDLTTNVTPRGTDDHIGQSIASMITKLNDMFIHINKSAHQVADGSRQIASGAQSLAHGSSRQAAAVDALSISMLEVADKTKRNADMANEAADLSVLIRDKAEKGSDQMEMMMESVRKINEASKEISKVIKTIDDIAFQTNILALNAAVEAARAGAHGKGFAVVADEVRNLAAKSAEAAKNTNEMINNSIQKANLGLNIATETSDSLKDIVDGINRSAEIVSRIAQFSVEQTTAIDNANSGIDQVAQVVQQNTATAEESAAASEEMSSQASVLESLISRFKLRAKSS